MAPDRGDYPETRAPALESNGSTRLSLLCLFDLSGRDARFRESRITYPGNVLGNRPALIGQGFADPVVAAMLRHGDG